MVWMEAFQALLHVLEEVYLSYFFALRLQVCLSFLFLTRSDLCLSQKQSRNIVKGVGEKRL